MPPLAALAVAAVLAAVLALVETARYAGVRATVRDDRDHHS
jgi:hypothetical protein